MQGFGGAQMCQRKEAGRELKAGIAQGEASANLGDSGCRQWGEGGERGQVTFAGGQSRDAEAQVALRQSAARPQKDGLPGCQHLGGQRPALG